MGSVRVERTLGGPERRCLLRRCVWGSRASRRGKAVGSDDSLDVTSMKLQNHQILKMVEFLTVFTAKIQISIEFNVS